MHILDACILKLVHGTEKGVWDDVMKLKGYKLRLHSWSLHQHFLDISCLMFPPLLYSLNSLKVCSFKSTSLQTT